MGQRCARGMVWIGIVTMGILGITVDQPIGDQAVVAQPLVAQSPTAQSTASRTLRGESAPFRVGNRSAHPVRVVLLQRRRDGDPAHWDFAPGEGGTEGLLLSLNEDPLVLEPGDVVVSFALDGSRRYWGPNVVGESQAPFWDPVRRIWSMILQP